MAWFERWCAGDLDAGQQLFRRHLPALYRFLSTKIDSKNLDDPVQETLRACVQRRDQFRRESSFRTFLFSIARLVVFEHWRSQRRHETAGDIAEMSVASMSSSVRTRLARREDRRRLLQALRELSLDEQVLIELHYWERMDGAELASIFGVEPATIRSRMFRARAALRENLRRAQLEPGPAEDDDFEGWARTMQPGLVEHGVASAEDEAAETPEHLDEETR
jgi:RNA polymerase sigma factor (sigma-70 family)